MRWSGGFGTSYSKSRGITRACGQWDDSRTACASTWDLPSRSCSLWCVGKHTSFRHMLNITQFIFLFLAMLKIYSFTLTYCTRICYIKISFRNFKSQARGNIQQKITQQKLLKNYFENLYKIRTKILNFLIIWENILENLRKLLENLQLFCENVKHFE